MMRTTTILFVLLTASAAIAEEAHRDLYGDPLPKGASMRLGTTRFRHEGCVRPLLYSPDGKLLIFSEGSRFIHFRDAHTGREIRRWSENAFSLALSPDGKVLVSGGNDTLRLWDVSTGKPLWSVDREGIASVVFSHDGKRLATSAYLGRICLWDAATGKCLQRFEKHNASDLDLAFSPDDRQLLSTVWTGGQIRLWEAATGKLKREFGKHIQAARFAPDGKTLVSGDSLGLIELWETATGKKVRSFKGHAYAIGDLLFTADGKTLISAGGTNALISTGAHVRERTIRVWDVAGGKQVRVLGRRLAAVNSLCLAPDEKTLTSAGADRVLRRWDLAGGKEIDPKGGHQDEIESLHFARDNKSLISLGGDGTRRVWDPASGAELRRRGCGSLDAVPTLTALSPDGRTLAWADYKNVYLRDTATNRDRARFTAMGFVEFLRFSPDGKILLGVPLSTHFHLWDTVTGKELHRPKMEEMMIDGNLVFSPDSRLLASGESLPGLQEKAICLWEVATGKIIRRIIGRRYLLLPRCFSADGRLLVGWSGSWAKMKQEQELIIWELATGSERMRLPMAHRNITAAAFSADGTMIAAGDDDGVVRVWDAIAGTERHRFTSDQRGISTLAFSADGTRLAGGGENSTILIWPVTRARRPPSSGNPLSTTELKVLWADLADRDGARAFAALKMLHARPESAVPFLRERLRPAIAAKTEALERLIAALDDDAFAVREAATTKLTQLGYAVEPLLHKALDGKPSPELRRRVDHLLNKLAADSPERLRAMRALELLGWLDTTESRRLLEDLSGGATDAWLTREAKRARERHR